MKLYKASILGGLLVAATSLFAQERKIQASALPPDVQKAAAEQSKGATVLGYSREVEKGQTYYEVEMRRDGRSEDVLFDSSGTLVEIEKEVPLASLPPGVREGLQKAGGDGKIVKVESLTKHGNLVAYEAQVQSGGKCREVQVGPGGEELDHEE